MAAFLLKINGVNRSAYLGSANERQIHFSSILGARGACGFTLYLPSGLTTFSPQLAIGQKIELLDPSLICVWAGTIDSFVETVPGGTPQVTVDVTCASLEQILDRRMTDIDALENVTAGDIITALYDKYLTAGSPRVASDLITLGTIDSGNTFATYVTNYGTLASYLNDLASQSDYYWYVDPQTFELNFLPRSSLTAAPFVISDTSTDILARPIREGNAGAGGSGGGLSREFSNSLTRQDFRDRQWVRLSYAAFAPQVETFIGTGPGQTFTLAKSVGQMVSITEQLGTVAATGTLNFNFGSNSPNAPNDGDTVTIGAVTYTWKLVLDNSVPNQILLITGVFGAVLDCCSFLFSTINGSGVPGLTYSTPTVANPAVTALVFVTDPTNQQLTVSYKAPGSLGNGFGPLTTTGATSWSLPTLTGGLDSSTAPNSATFGQLGIDLNANYLYRYGFSDLQLNSNYQGPAVGSVIVVTYYVIGADVLGVQDDDVIAARAAVEGNSGLYEFITDESSNANPDLGLVKAQSLLDAFKTLPGIVYVEIRKPGLQVGQIATVHMTNPAISGTFLVNEIQGYSIPGDPYPRYQIELLSTARIGTWLQLWQLLATTGSGGAGGGGGGTGGVPTIDTGATINGVPVLY